MAIGAAVIFQLVLRYLPFGRRLFAIGTNPDGAQLVGMPVQRDVFVAFMLSGALAGLAGFMFMSRFGNITVAAGIGLELQVIAAVVVGGVAIFGGVGSMSAPCSAPCSSTSSTRASAGCPASASSCATPSWAC